jgi:hypothetical protein
MENAGIRNTFAIADKVGSRLKVLNGPYEAWRGQIRLPGQTQPLRKFAVKF